MKPCPSVLGSTCNAFEKFKMFAMVCLDGSANCSAPVFTGIEAAGVTASVLEGKVGIVFFRMLHGGILVNYICKTGYLFNYCTSLPNLLYPPKLKHPVPVLPEQDAKLQQAVFYADRATWCSSASLRRLIRAYLILPKAVLMLTLV